MESNQFLQLVFPVQHVTRNHINVLKDNLKEKCRKAAGAQLFVIRGHFHLGVEQEIDGNCGTG